MKKTITTVALLGMAVTLASCSNLFGSDETEINPTETLAFEAATAIALFDAPSATMTTMQSAPRTPYLLDDGSEDTSEEAPIEDSSEEEVLVSDPAIDQLVAQLDFLYTNGNGFETTTAISDLEGYENLQEITFTAPTGELETYKLYYNEEDVLVKGDDEGGNQAGPSEEHDNGEFEAETNSNEVKTKITGVAIIDETEYQFVSHTEIEIDEEDGEYEEEIRFRLFLDDNNYVMVKQEIEVEENEKEEKFVYRVVEDGVLTQNYTLKIEQDDEKDDEAKMRILIDGNIYQLRYEEVVDGDAVAIIKVVVNDELVATYEKVVTTNEETGEQTVTYQLIGE